MRRMMMMYKAKVLSGVIQVLQVTVLTCSLRIPGRELRPGTTIRIFSNPLRWLFSIRVQMYL